MVTPTAVQPTAPAATDTPQIFTPTVSPSAFPPTSVPAPVSQNSFAVAFSADGLSLAFNSDLDGLTPEDLNRRMDPFVFNTHKGSIQWVHNEKEDLTIEHTARRATSLSANGRYLLYGASANAAEPAADHYNFIYLRDLQTGQDERIDFVPLEKQLSTSSVYPSLSPDGRYLALEAAADHWNIYLLERASGKLIPVSVNPNQPFLIADSHEPVFSPDGHYLAFVSSASDLAPGDEPCADSNPHCADVFIYQIATGKIERIAAQIQFTEGGPYPNLTVSNFARWLAWAEVDYSSPSFNKVIRLFDRLSGKIETVCTGAAPSCTGHSPSISADGRWLAFSAFTKRDASSEAHDQVYLLDHETGQLTMISVDAQGRPGDGESGVISLQQEGFSSDVRISGDGRFVAFSSQTANLLPAGAKKRPCFDPIIAGAYPCYDLFVYDRQKKELNWISWTSTSLPVPQLTDEQVLAKAVLNTEQNAYCNWIILGYGTDTIYAWVRCDLQVEPFSAGSVPAVIHLAPDGHYTRAEIPGDGTQYPVDIQRLFPAGIQSMIFGHNLSFDWDWALRLRQSGEISTPYVSLAFPMDVPGCAWKKEPLEDTPASIAPDTNSWKVISEAEAGFSLSIPPDWSAGQMLWQCANQAPVPHFLYLTSPDDHYQLGVGFRRPDQPVYITRTGTPAGDFVADAPVRFFGKELSAQRLVYQGNDMAVFYNGAAPLAANAILFTLSLDINDPWRVPGLPSDVEDQARLILASFQRYPSINPNPTSTDPVSANSKNGESSVP